MVDRLGMVGLACAGSHERTPMQMHGGPGPAQRREACSHVPLGHAVSGIPSRAESTGFQAGPAIPPRRAAFRAVVHPSLSPCPVWYSGQNDPVKATKGRHMTKLAAGAAAPPFSLPRDGGGTVSLRDFKGKKLVLYFYPRADTPGCTREAQAFSALAK